MRFTSTLVLSASLVLLSMGAHAAAPSNWPSQDARTKFVNDCASAASQSVDAKTATAHCECGADKLNAELTTKEIQELTTSKAPSQALQTKAVAAISSCKVVKK